MTHLVEWIWDQGLLRAVVEAGGPAIRRSALLRERARYAHVHLPGDDAQAEVNRYLATSLLALSELLERSHGWPRPNAVTLARAAFLSNGQSLMKFATLAWLRLTPDPFAALRSVGPKTRMGRLWGRGMDAVETHETGRITLKVTGCAFAEFFWNAGRSDLMPILCAYDAQWFAWINGARRGLRVRRSGTIPSGDGGCAFIFEGIEERSQEPVPTERRVKP